MNDAALARAADANYADTARLIAAVAEDGAAEERDGLVLASSGVTVAMFNVAFVPRPLADPEAAIGGAIAYFDNLGLPFHVRVREGVDEGAEQEAVAQGLELSGVQPGMCLHPIPDAAPVPEGMRIDVVNDPGTWDAYIETMTTGFQMPLEIARRVFIPDRLATLEEATWYLGSVDGVPAATSALVNGPEGVAGIYNVATLEAFRRRGLGEAITWRAINDGRRAGATIATLQSSDMGKPIYERMGFRTVAPYRIYTRPV